jgi:membrane-bound lytic murein transglycosylase MltF
MILNRLDVTKWLKTCSLLGALFFGASLAALAQQANASTPQPAPTQRRALPTDAEEWKGDFDGMFNRRHIRVLVPYSRTLYFNDKGQERGVVADNVRDFEGYINKKYKKQLGNRPITVYLIPTTRDLLLRKVADGFGDIAVGNLTATDERKKVVDFVAPADQRPISELVVTGPKSPSIASADDLAGKTVHVRKASSYYESLNALNSRLKKAGKPAVKLVLVPDALEDEDMLEMLNAGLLEAIVADDWKAKIWGKLLPNVKVNEGAVVRSGGLIGWGIRKGSPKLDAELNDYYVNFMKKHGTVNWRRLEYYKRIKQITESTGSAEMKRFHDVLEFFRKYGEKYSFDPLMLAAQGYQESQLNQNAKSRVGAIGVMQLMPATGKEMKVGDIKVTEANIHAGTKYMDHLMTRYFPDAKFSEANRSLFAFAAYNAGPGRIAGMRKEAVKRGLDPEKWFNNVEIVTAEKVGIETTTYVRNIFKYYTAYKLMLDLEDTQKKARETIKQRS